MLGILIAVAVSAWAKDSAPVKWTDRVIPLPKEMRVVGSMTMSAGEIMLKPLTYSALSTVTVSNLLTAFAKGNERDAKVTMKLMLLGSVPLDAAIPHRLATLPNSDQAYAIITEKSWFSRKVTIRIIAKTPMGLLYASRTLNQLVMPRGNITAATPVEFPLVTITDWPDMTLRGQSSADGAIPALRMMPWTAQWKLNLIDLENIILPVSNNLIVSDGNRISKYTRYANIFEAAAEQGVTLVPNLSHLEQQGQFFAAKVRTQPELARFRPILKTMEPGKAPDGRGFCYSNPLTVDMLTAWITQMAEMIKPYGGRDINIWLSEGPAPCACKDCAGKDPYEFETRAIAQAYARVKARYPDLRLCVLTTQGSEYCHDKVIAALPADTGLIYYSGGGSYNCYRKPMIVPVLEQASRAGRPLGVLPIISPAIATVFPMTSPQFIRYRVKEFVDKGLDSIRPWIIPDNEHYRFNIAAMAEWTWNVNGRSEEDFARAYATITEVDTPRLFAQWAMANGEAAWCLAESGFIDSTAYDPGNGFFNTKPFYKQMTNSPLANPTNMAIALASAREARHLALESKVPELVDESEVNLAGLEAFDNVMAISRLVDRAKTGRDDKKTLADKMDDLDRCAHVVQAGVQDWENRVAAGTDRNLGKDKIGFSPDRYFNLISRTPAALLRLADTIRIVTARFGIPDPRPESRAMDAGEWTVKDFTNGQATVTYNVTALVPEAGGSYHVCLNYMDGVFTGWDRIALISNGRVLTNYPSLEWRWLTGFLNESENPVVIPARHPGENLMLLVHLVAAGVDGSRPGAKQVCEGLISLRRVWPRGQSPWDLVSHLAGEQQQ